MPCMLGVAQSRRVESGWQKLNTVVQSNVIPGSWCAPAVDLSQHYIFEVTIHGMIKSLTLGLSSTVHATCFRVLLITWI